MDTILDIQNLKTHFYTDNGVAKAVNGVSFSMNKGEIVGVVGESGSGKSVTAFSILRLVSYPGKIVEGKILFNEIDLLQISKTEIRKLRGDRISMIFQEPMISLNPAFTIENQLVEAVQAHRNISKAEARNRAIEMLQKVDIPAPEKRIKDYPHQLSGGMRQRVMIVESLLLNPDILLADEPTTALDVTIQAQVLDVLYKLVNETKTAIMLITHNLGIVAEFAERVVVMYAGRVVEIGSVKNIFENTFHPYTSGLIKSIPRPRQKRSKQHKPLYEMTGIVPSFFNMPSGCTFHPRCPRAMAKCHHQTPPKTTINSAHHVWCWLNE